MLSLAMIVKNEAKTIERAVLSVKDYVDEVVIGIDEASTDGTDKLVERLVDKVVPIYLSEEMEKKGPRDGEGDWGFSKARNRVFDACSHESWRLILDGHELVNNPEAIVTVVKTAIDSGCDGVEIPVRFDPDKNGIPGIEYKQGRLLAPSVRYKNAQHNVPMVQRTHTSDAISIDHCKKNQAIESKQARDVQRSDANIAAFKAKIEENPQDSRSWFYLGQAYKESACWKEGVEAYEAYLKVSQWKEERWHARVNMGTCLSRLGDKEKARDQFVLALEEFPAMAEAYFYLADMAYKQKRYREAQVWLEKCIELDQPYCKLFVNPKIYLVDRHDLLSMVYNHLGFYAQAIDQAKKALEAAPNPRIEKNVAIWSTHIDKHGASLYDGIWESGKGPSALEGQRLDFMANALGDVERVLDVGSGPAWILDKLEDVSYTGLDISIVARKIVEAKGGKAVASLEELNGDKFDGCVFGETLEHIQDDVGMLRSVKAHLEAGAKVVVSVPRFGSMYDPAHTRDYTAKELEQLLSTLGDPESLGTIGPWVIYRCVVG